MTATAVTYTTNLVSNPSIDALALNNATLNAVGNSTVVYIGEAKHIELLVNLGIMTGTASVTFHVSVLGGDGTTVIKTYDGVAKSASNAVDSIMVDSTVAASPLGTKIMVTWTTSGNLDGSNYFSNCYVQLIAK